MNFKDLFKTGHNYKVFLCEKEGAYKEKIEDLVDNLNVKEETKDRIAKIEEDINILIAAEVWCPDCVLNVPGALYISKLNPKVKLSFIKREGNEESLQEFAIDGKVKIPTFIVMDKDFKLKGTLVERPKNIKEVENQDDQVKRIVEMKKYRSAEYIDKVVEELMDIIEG
ncbi:thioredoxin family protein [Hathewaya massiliensis]|uniref:thioredoxin family protein n=1 Tax=Hathewaya massiliensis TaxID=1964382 RepID=UPI001157BBB6|nr:thioredoxin family protein [Hathewaya massiliensis]